ncbi:MAG TPA: hypothetical protein VFO11_10800 [Candidatus Polarisedimenticolaceae bacterium]|nr:hypothetical protein [Candidatus Polarisedimenticolaceae bacterium]
MHQKVRALALLVASVAISVGLAAVAAPSQAQSCEPVICPAIAKFCPEGQVACRVSPCNCNQVCVSADRGCRF